MWFYASQVKVRYVYDIKYIYGLNTQTPELLEYLIFIGYSFTYDDLFQERTAKI